VAVKELLINNMHTVQKELLGPLASEVRGIVNSSDGRHLAYITRRGQKQFVVVDGQARAEYDGILKGSPIFSPDGNHFAYIAAIGGLVFTPDGKRVSPPAGFDVERVGIKPQRQFVVMDGHSGTECDEIGDVVFSRDCRQVAYKAKRGQTWWSVK
jgi:hypothetical protein